VDGWVDDNVEEEMVEEEEVELKELFSTKSDLIL